MFLPYAHLECVPAGQAHTNGYTYLGYHSFKGNAQLLYFILSVPLVPDKLAEAQYLSNADISPYLSPSHLLCLLALAKMLEVMDLKASPLPVVPPLALTGRQKTQEWSGISPQPSNCRRYSC